MNGGQSVQHLDPAGEMITATNTEEYWNHHPGWSIMRLGGRYNCFRRGDLVVMIVEVRLEVDKEAALVLNGDGGRTAPDRPWACSWKDRTLNLRPASTWTRQVIETTVTPTLLDYDPAVRGTALHLLTSVGRGTAHFKRIEILRIPG